MEHYCFDLSGIILRSRADIEALKKAWYTFDRVETFDARVSTSIGGVYPGLTSDALFYQFRSAEEKMIT